MEMVELARLAAPPEGRAHVEARDGAVVLQVAPGAPLVVPDGTIAPAAEFVRSGADLVLVGPGGAPVVVKDYFALDPPPVLVTEGGASVPPDLVAELAATPAPGQLAQAEASVAEAGVAEGGEAEGEAPLVDGDAASTLQDDDSAAAAEEQAGDADEAGEAAEDVEVVEVVEVAEGIDIFPVAGAFIDATGDLEFASITIDDGASFSIWTGEPGFQSFELPSLASVARTIGAMLARRAP